MISYNYCYMDSLPWIVKYRPPTLDDIISQELIIKTLKIFFSSNDFPHLLFYGPSGTGKSSAILTGAKQIFGEITPYNVMELNASNDRGIKVVRQRIKTFASTHSQDKFKLIILDEADAITEDAQSVLRQIMDNYSYNVKFCLICNYIRKIIPSIQSRTICFRFVPLNNNQMKNKIKEICKKENITITKRGLDLIIKISDGDMRKALNTLQTISSIEKNIDYVHINKVVNHPNEKIFDNVYDSILNDDFNTCINNTLNIKNTGITINDIFNEMFIRLLNDYNKNILTDSEFCNIMSNLRKIEDNNNIILKDSIQLIAMVSSIRRYKHLNR